MREEPVTEHRTRHDGVSGTSITTTLVYSVAAVAGVEPTALPPLHRSLDADALEAILGSTRDGEVTVTFTYAGYRVTAHSDGSLRIGETARGR